MNDQDDQGYSSLGYTGPAVIATLTWAKKTEPEASNSSLSPSNDSDEHIPMPLKASGVLPTNFDFGPSDGALEISEDESPEARLVKIAINFVKISQLFGNGRWVTLSSRNYRNFCAPRKVPSSERSLFLDLVLRGVLIADGDEYTVGPQMAFFLSGHVTNFSDSLAA